jgi:O-antigen biosynthesis protein
VTAPELTISILVYGPSPYLPGVLDAVRDNTSLPYELLLLDHGTTEDTRVRMGEVEGARVVNPGRNLGFGAGHDYAANLASGRYFCALNSDAIVPPHWDRQLTRPLASPNVGATMPVLVYPDGRLQEAGATVEPSGQVIAFGRFDDPDNDAYRLSGPVPFATAACMMMRTEAFRGAGGFDARYGVAYYEDVDLAFALHLRGMQIELVADVRVVHAQGASSATSHDAEQLLLGNRERFRTRYASMLAGRPYVYNRAESHHLAAARDFDCCDRVLFVIDELPPCDAGQDHVAARLDACREQLAAGRVTVAATLADTDRQAAWRTRGVETVALDDIDAILLARRFHFAAIVVAPALRARLTTALDDTQPQAVVADLPGDEPTMDQNALEAWIGSLDLVPTLRSL